LIHIPFCYHRANSFQLFISLQELETSDPNFIVVYDLQSGTLFKKWKAGANTVAVSIACQNTCVVTSLQDARILVWDLGTGYFLDSLSKFYFINSLVVYNQL